MEPIRGAGERGTAPRARAGRLVARALPHARRGRLPRALRHEPDPSRRPSGLRAQRVRGHGQSRRAWLPAAARALARRRSRRARARPRGVGAGSERGFVAGRGSGARVGRDRAGPRGGSGRRCVGARGSGARAGRAGAIAERHAGGSGWPFTHCASPPSKCSFFQIGTLRFSSSITQRAASNTAPRCGALVTTATLASVTGTTPSR